MTENELRTLGDVLDSVGTWLTDCGTQLHAQVDALKVWLWSLELVEVGYAASIVLAVVIAVGVGLLVETDWRRRNSRDW